MARTVTFAVYGGIRDGSAHAADVKTRLQELVNAGAQVAINNETLRIDPAVGVQKHFGAIIDIDGVSKPFACREGEEINVS